MQTTLTVRLSEEEARWLQTMCESMGKTRSELVREALRAHICHQKLDADRAIAVLRAYDAGLLTDESTFNDAS